ncbi:MAG: thymidine phosphorylase family protein [Nanoarchaeota archaeon]|nr:thymidine phosphorylase family protein [Nanoarchaeota archaeon]
MLLKVKSLKFLAGRPVAIMNSKTAKRLSIFVGERIRIKDHKEITAIVDLAQGVLKENEIALSKEIFDEMGISEGYAVEVNAAPRPKSAEHILEKLDGKELDYESLYEISEDIVHNALTESEIAYFISGMYFYGMTEKETVSFTKAMVATGKSINIKNAVDKHSIGGIAGNRTTPIVISICASTGLIMPKTSSRAITSAAGTADVMECFTKVDFNSSEIKKIVNKVGACLVWGGALNLAPADDKIIQVERILGLDPEVQLLASILSKKISIGAKKVLIDIPYGKSAKVDKKKAIELSQKFRKIGNLLGIKVKTMLSDGSQPIGNGIGPALEARDVYKILSRAEDKPLDLEKKSLIVAGNMLEMTGKARKGEGQKKALEILDSGKALKKFIEILEAQNGSIKNLAQNIFHENKSFTINAERSGIVREICNKRIASVAFSAGCPADKYAGIFLHIHNGFKVKKGDSLLTIYAETNEKLGFAKKTYFSLNPILIK